MQRLQAGSRVADRFAIEELAGRGAMGAVFRARDDETGETVALKVAYAAGELEPDRLALEARVLSELRHPGIVRHVAHGVFEGKWYLAMEWLVGEDLGKHLRKKKLERRDAVLLVQRVADALGHAHRVGVIHRDIKPSNLFLVGGDPSEVRVLDFGIARRTVAPESITHTGVMLGTPGYMSAEQARGEPDIDARADVYALGCVLYKCVAGKAAFQAENFVGLLAKILLDEPPRLREMADVSDALDTLVFRMMAKDRAGRPANGATVAADLASLLETGDLEATSARVVPVKDAPRSITRSEQRLVAVVLARLGEPTLRDDDAPTLASTDGTAMALLAVQIERLGGRLDQLADGSLLVSLRGAGADAATDIAARAARCALAMRASLGDARLALAMGLAEVTERALVGEVIERAARILDLSATSGARTDEATARLLEGRFAVGSDAHGLFLRGEGANQRLLLGRPTSCFGRERELRNLESIYEECVVEPLARVVLVTAPAGVGKSRLCNELVARLAKHGAPPLVLSSRGDPMSTGSPLGLLAEQIRTECGVELGGDALVQREMIERRVARHVDEPRRQQVSAFLGEIVGVEFPDDDSAPLRTARRDPIVMGDLMRRAWEDFIEAELRHGPVLMVFEDLHWGDPGTVSFVEGALRLHRSKPLMALALARPDVMGIFPELWKRRDVEHVELRDLPPSACQELVREAMGARATSEVTARLVEQAQGNAFYLEELIRAEVDGKGSSTPPTVTAMVQTRLEALDPEMRRALRAASVFGEVFWNGAVAALVGEGTVDFRLSELADREVIVRSPRARFPGQDEYAFRHSLVRDVAHAMLTPADLELAHKLAGQWLEAAGETDAASIAEHLERGDEKDRALVWWERAARSALEANDFALAIARADAERRAARRASSSPPSGSCKPTRTRGEASRRTAPRAPPKRWTSSLRDGRSGFAPPARSRTRAIVRANTRASKPSRRSSKPRARWRSTTSRTRAT